ncbi:MAG: Signal transduction histidine kinase [Rhizobium sp.]|nr:Signal transduction histidine kinase [Rhizobium sp.]
MNGPLIESTLDWVLILAPFRKDADYIMALLGEQDVEVKTGRSDDEVAKLLSLSPGVIVIAHEALIPRVVAIVGEHLASQPDWSELPILILLERAAPISRIRSQLERCWPGARLLFHIRPIARLELMNSIQSNLLVRLRQRQVRNAIEREKELRLELNHRIKNILASVTSIFRMTRRGATTVDELAGDFTGRLQALSSVHTAVFEANGEDVSLAAMVDLTVSPYNSTGSKRIRASGPNIAINRDAATTIALCLHELITNAIKYGALSQDDGVVDIVWTVSEEDEPVVSLRWAEAGGPDVVEPTRQGYGTRYIRSALASVFGSVPEIAFAPDGFRCSVAGALSRLSKK